MASATEKSCLFNQSSQIHIFRQGNLYRGGDKAKSKIFQKNSLEICQLGNGIAKKSS